MQEFWLIFDKTYIGNQWCCYLINKTGTLIKRNTEERNRTHGSLQEWTNFFLLLLMYCYLLVFVQPQNVISHTQLFNGIFFQTLAIIVCLLSAVFLAIVGAWLIKKTLWNLNLLLSFYYMVLLPFVFLIFTFIPIDRGCSLGRRPSFWCD